MRKDNENVLLIVLQLETFHCLKFFNSKVHIHFGIVSELL